VVALVCVVEAGFGVAEIACELFYVIGGSREGLFLSMGSSACRRLRWSLVLLCYKRNC
jgi:hypothetical protein